MRLCDRCDPYTTPPTRREPHRRFTCSHPSSPMYRHKCVPEWDPTYTNSRSTKTYYDPLSFTGDRRGGRNLDLGVWAPSPKRKMFRREVIHFHTDTYGEDLGSQVKEGVYFPLLYTSRDYFVLSESTFGPSSRNLP